jgi:hypothetical protein
MGTRGVVSSAQVLLVLDKIGTRHNESDRVGSASLDRCNFVLGPERPANGQTGSGPITSCWPTKQKLNLKRPLDRYDFPRCQRHTN